MVTPKTIKDYFAACEEEAVVLTAAFEKAKKKKDENKKPKIEIKHPGAFRDWCDKQGLLDEHGEVTCECLCAAMKTDDPVLHKRANFAYNFGFKRNGKACECMEKLRAGKEDDISAGQEGVIEDIAISIASLLDKGFSALAEMLNKAEIVVDNTLKYVTSTRGLVHLSMNLSLVKKQLNNDNLDIERILHTEIPVALGFKPTIEESIDVFRSMAVHKNSILRLLDQMYHDLSEASGADIEYVKRKILAINTRQIHKEQDAIKKALRDLIDDNNLIDVKKIKDLIPNLNRFPTVALKLLKIGKDYRQEDLEELSKEVSALADTLDGYVDTIKDNKNIDEKMVKQLAENVRLLAEAVTDIALTYYMFYQVLDMMSKIMIVINNKYYEDTVWYERLRDNITSLFKGIF